MVQIDRRRLLLTAAASMALPSAIARAWAIDADKRTGTIKDVDHVVILMQENRSFDHYFGTMNGVRGFADRFPIPLPDAPGAANRTVWTQLNTRAPEGQPKLIAPFALNTQQTFQHMRVEGTPHNWPDAQFAWDEGRMASWPGWKGAHSMGHYEKADIPFQWALADAFTLCDAYHCSFQGGTNTNRLFLWTGTNDPSGKLGGPSISNSHDHLPKDEKDSSVTPYLWPTYTERLEKAGVSWRIYEDMADNFGDNPVVGFKTFRDSIAKAAGSNPRLAELGHSTRHLDGLREDVMSGKLPQVSYVVSPAKDSEHPGPSSPAQGADYVARVLDCLTSNPQVWARTVFLVMYDENDGFFDHAPPPAAPSRDASGAVRGGSTVDATAEYHLNHTDSEKTSERPELNGRPYGLGPRVPLWIISPWSRGGYVNSQVCDHTSVIRFLETRFGVKETNISAWRRAVCGDLTSCFDFKTPNDTPAAQLPETASTAAKAAALPGRTIPPTPAQPSAPKQADGVRPSRPLPYDLDVAPTISAQGVQLAIRNTGKAAAVVHVYNRLDLAAGPHRYTVEPGKTLTGSWPAGRYDLWITGPNGFHRHFTGDTSATQPAISIRQTKADELSLRIANPSAAPLNVSVGYNTYMPATKNWAGTIKPGGNARVTIDIAAAKGWHDVSVRCTETPGFLHRIAGRRDTGKPTTTDPAMSGAAIMQQPDRA